jgi:hypothetical protein
LFFAIISCESDDAINLDNTSKLSDVILNRTIETGAVIACAASNPENIEIVNIYFYPETGATNIQFFETNTTNIDSNDYANYQQLDISSEPFFNGYLRKFTRSFALDQWIIITYELDGEVKISNPIRTKNNSKPTIWTDEVVINQDVSTMPTFSWTDNANGDNAIYFQVISTVTDDLLSGTYTFENQFQYYNTSNVVLNITNGTPQDLTIGNSYKFTLMDVSEDNWVNTVIQDIFVVQ